MRKKWIFSSVLLSCLVGIIYLTMPSPKPLPTYCAFCDATVLNHQKFYEDELVIALCTHKPMTPGHCLVIPKRHVERFEGLTDAEILQIGRVIKKVDQAIPKVFQTSPYLLLQKNGPEAGQSVPHVHVHYIPRKAGDSSQFGLMFQMYIANVKAPIPSEKMEATVAKIRQAMDE
jgi:histidine triad (HIT) family protein